ncbi:MAG: glycoside hydrolase family 65 protein [Anaerolineae bacterium]|nr:glycoside hydrolase family 65 protein [Anaerolineae bacterium]
MDDAWALTEPAFDVAHAKAYEGLFTLGSGYLHVRGSLEEHLHDAPQNADYMRRPTNTTAEKFPEPKVKWGAFVPGVYGNHPLLNQEMVNLPYFLELTPYVDGEKLDMEASAVEAYRRTLHLDTAALTRSLRWQTRHGAAVAVRFERFISAARPHLCLQRITLESDRDITVELHAGIDTDVRTSGYDHLRDVMLTPLGENGVACNLVTDYGDAAHIVTRIYAGAAERAYVDAGRAARWIIQAPLTAGEPVEIEKRTAVATSQDAEAVNPIALLVESEALSYEALYAEHAAVWRARWEQTDVVIEGDAAAQLKLRAALYHLMRAHPGDSRCAIGPKGYAGDAYRGCYFWDTEIYMLPFFLYTDPARARMLTDFRIHTLPGAQANAARYGYEGAKYPWESDRAGNECCAQWQYADHEVHVTADVVYGMAHYARAAGDAGYLRGPAAPVILEAARYWMQRLNRRAGDQHFSLLGVMGPDEYAPLTNNNSYTNRMVVFALETASEVAAAAHEHEMFKQLAGALPIVGTEDGLVLQCEDFEAFAEPEFDAFWPDRDKPFAAQVSQERLYRTKALKQADVILLMMLFPHEFSAEEIRLAWDYYLPLTTHDSSLSAGVHAVVAARLGLMDEAVQFWQRSLDLDTDVTHGGASEGIHVAAAGLNWQIVVFGFGGVHTAMQADVLTLTPRLPANWTRLAFPFVWKGAPLYVDIRPGAVHIANRGSRPLDVRVGDRAATIPAGDAVTLESRHGSSST